MNTKAALLVDGSNAHATVRPGGWQIDYDKFRKFLPDVARAVYFTALPPSTEQSTLRPLIDYLDYNGWTICKKDWKELTNLATGEVEVKGNMDVEIAVIAVELARSHDTIYLFSGDGDFTFLVDSLQRQYGTRVVVISSIRTQPAMCADTLRRQADAFIDVCDPKIRVQIERTEQRSPRDTPRNRFLNNEA